MHRVGFEFQSATRALLVSFTPVLSSCTCAHPSRAHATHSVDHVVTPPLNVLERPTGGAAHEAPLDPEWLAMLGLASEALGTGAAAAWGDAAAVRRRWSLFLNPHISRETVV